MRALRSRLRRREIRSEPLLKKPCFRREIIVGDCSEERRESSSSVAAERGEKKERQQRKDIEEQRVAFLPTPHTPGGF